MKFILAVIMSVVFFNAQAHTRVLFDEAHLESCGNADWTTQGGYSDYAKMLRKYGFEVFSAPFGELSESLLSDYDILVLAEPNEPFSAREISAIKNFVKKGGSLFLIADHDGSDRNFDGMDSLAIFNVFCRDFGFEFNKNSFSSSHFDYFADHPAVSYVSQLACFAATDINPLSNSCIPVIGNGKNSHFAVVSVYGKGRVAACGDSSIFDDGTGDPEKVLHDSFNSVMYDNAQFGLNIMCWLAHNEPVELDASIIRSPAPFYHENHENSALIDISHLNGPADKMEEFIKELVLHRVKPFYLKKQFSDEVLKGCRLVVISTPAVRYTDSECAALKKWMEAGGKMIITAESARKSDTHIQYINQLLEKTGSATRCISAQILDNRNNTGSAWGVMLSDFYDGLNMAAGTKTIAFSACYLKTDSDSVIPLARANTETYAVNMKGKTLKTGKLICDSFEKIGNGSLMITSSCHLVDYQYPSSRIYPHAMKRISHDTPLYNTKTVEFLLQN